MQMPWCQNHGVVPPSPPALRGLQPGDGLREAVAVEYGVSIVAATVGNRRCFGNTQAGLLTWAGAQENLGENSSGTEGE